MAYVNRKVWAHRLENEVATISLVGVVRVTDNSRSGSQEQTDELRRSRESIGGVTDGVPVYLERVEKRLVEK